MPALMTLLLALSVACRPADSLDSSPTVPTDSDTTRPASELRVAGFTVSGAFGYDPDNQRALPYYFGDITTPEIMPWLEFYFSLEADNQLPGPCRISVQLSATPVDGAPWSADPVMFGIDYPWDDLGYDDTCPDMDPAIYPDTLINLIKAWTFGIGVTPITDDGYAAIEAHVVDLEGQIEWDTYWADNVVGGAVSWAALDGLSTEGWALGFEVDDDMVLTSQAPSAEGPPPPPHDPSLVVALPRETIEAATGLPRGVYAVNSRIQFSPEDLLP